LTNGLVYGLYGGLICLALSIVTEVNYVYYGVIIIGMIFGLSRTDEHLKPTDKIIWSWNIVGIGFIGGMIVFLGFVLFGMLIGFFPSFRFRNLLVIPSKFGLRLGLIFGSFSSLIIMLIGVQGGITVDERSDPGKGITTTWKNSLKVFVISFIPAVISGLVFGLTFSPLIERETLNPLPISELLIIGSLFGLIVGLFFWLIYGGEFLINHFVSRFYLYQSSYLPWNLISFLDYAIHRIFLRRVGGGYSFIHRMLMEHFAEMELETEK